MHQVTEQEESHCRTCVLIVIAFVLRTTFWWVSSGHGDGNKKKKSNALVVRQLMAASMIGGHPNQILVIQDSTEHREAKNNRAHAAPERMCGNLINSLKLLTNQQGAGDSPVENIVTGSLEKESQRYFGQSQEVHRSNNHDAVKVGGLCSSWDNRFVGE